MAAKWLTTKSVCQQLDVSEHTLRYWLRQGLVPGAGKLPSGEYRLPADSYKHLVRQPQKRVADE